MKVRAYICSFVFSALALVSCRHDVVVFPTEKEDKGEAEVGPVRGFYLLNEGNMGSNKCTLDYYDYASALYTRNIYGEANPDVVKELGDVGNDLQIYGSRMWAVINCSNKVEVMEAGSARRIGQVEIPNCRYLAFEGGYAYCTSYAGPVQVGPEHAQLGYVAKIDTASLEVVDKCMVGYQPDGIVALDGKLYVANSGGYMVGNYENTLSVIDIESFEELGRIPVAINLDKVLADKRGCLWVSSRGDYYDTEASLHMLDKLNSDTPIVTEIKDEQGRGIAVSAMCISGDSLYYVGNRFSYVTFESEIAYGIIDLVLKKCVSQRFITDGTDKKISMPYTVAVNADNGDILVGDARNYVNPGRLFCFSPDGILKWDVRTGDIPAHVAFVR